MSSTQKILIMLAICLAVQFNYSAGQSLHELLDHLTITATDNTDPSNESVVDVQVSHEPYASASSDPKFDPQISDLLATNVLQMAHDLGEILLNSNSKKTEIFSPISIYGALSLVLLGSSGNTYQELLTVMGLSKDQYLINNPWKIHEEFGLLIEDMVQNSRNEAHPRPQPNWKLHENRRENKLRNDKDGDEYKVAVANGVFVNDGFSIRPEYQNAVLDVYKSHMKSLDFSSDSASATKYINDWVNEKTNGKIPEIVSFFLPETKVVLASALYFNATWETTFMEGYTKLRDFYPDGLGTTPIQVEMMAQGGTFPFYDAREFDCQIVALPYRRNLSTMYIILPNNSNRTRLRELQSDLTADKIELMISKMKWESVVIVFPKMHISNEIDLKGTFEEMGLHSLFDERRSDLSLVSNGQEMDGEQKPILPISSSASSGFTTTSDDEMSAQDNTTNESTEFRVSDYSPVNDHVDEPFIFSVRRKRNTSYKVPSSQKIKPTLTFKDYILSKRIVKGNSDKKRLRRRRQVDPSESLKSLDRLRTELSQGPSQNPGLFASEIKHKVDLTINEKGTEGGAATFVLTLRTATTFRADTPFMLIVRHDDTKLPLFYGTVVEPTN